MTQTISEADAATTFFPNQDDAAAAAAGINAYEPSIAAEPIAKSETPAVVPLSSSGKIKTSVPGTGNGDARRQLPAASDLAAHATEVANELRGCPRSIIKAAKLIKHVYDNFGPEEQRRFPTYLAERRVIPFAEARMGRDGTRLRKLLVIADADWLENPELTEFLPPGYSPLYHMVLLHNALAATSPEQKLNELVAILATAKGAITRLWLIDAKKRLSQKSEPQGFNEESTSQAPESNDTPKKHTDAEPDQALQKLDLLLLTPGPRDLKWLRHEYGLNYLESCLQLLSRTDENGAAIVISATFADLPEIFKLLILCGFKKPSQILQPRVPASSDIDSEVVIVVAERGTMHMTPIGDSEWLADGNLIDPTKIAERLFQNAARKWHGFTDVQTDGWTCLTSAKTWKEEPILND